MLTADGTQLWILAARYVSLAFAVQRMLRHKCMYHFV
jgi:hypothetical protein